MKTTLKVDRRFDYDNEYSIDIDTTKDLTQEEYKTIVTAVKQIKAIFDTHLDVLFAKTKGEKEKKNG